MNTMTDADLVAALRAADPAPSMTVSAAEAARAVRRARTDKKARRWLLVSTGIVLRRRFGKRLCKDRKACV